MKKQVLLFVIGSLITFISNAQMDAVSVAGIFERIMNEVKSYKLDTSAVPNEKITRKINELRQLRGGFNINESHHV